MKRFVLLDTAAIPPGALCLFEYGDDFVIKIQGGNGNQLMNTRTHGSEDALAEIPCKRIASRAQVRVLIGGLGMGFTLASALRQLGADAEVLVAELVPGVIEWNRGALGEKSGHPLRDARTRVLNQDVAELLRAQPEGFDAIMLDVDNGPEGLTQKRNSWLYSLDGLDACARALRPGGVLAVWSASADRAFPRSSPEPASRPRRCRCTPMATAAPDTPSGLPTSASAERLYQAVTPSCNASHSAPARHISAPPAACQWKRRASTSSPWLDSTKGSASAGRAR